MAGTKQVGAAMTALKSAVEAGDSTAAVAKAGELLGAMAAVGHTGATGAKATGVGDCTTEGDELEAACQAAQAAPKAKGVAAGFDWSQLIPLVLQILELWRSRK